LATPLGQAAPHVMQFFGSLVVSTHVPPQSVGALGGQVATHEYAPLTAAHTGAVAPHTLPQLPQLETLVPSTQPPSQEIRPLPQPPWPVAPASPASVLPIESLPVESPVSFVPSAPALPSMLASHPAGQSAEVYALNPETAAHAPIAPASAAVAAIPRILRTTQV
jgi:hypothetical protein